MKHLIILSILTMFSLSCNKKKEIQYLGISDGIGVEKAEKHGFKLGIQSYTFHKFSLIECLDKVDSLNIKYIEIYPGHRLGGEWGNKTFGFDLSADDREAIKKYAAERNIKIVGHGVYTTDKSEDWERVFSFAKDMEMEHITCEPQYEHLELVETLAKQYNIKVGIHNHPQPSDYYDPNILFEKLERQDKLVGACADPGHWRRDGFDQLDALRKLGDRVISTHMKDLGVVKYDDVQLEDCIWSFGILDIHAMLLILKENNFNGYITIEYETNWENSLQDIKDCIFYYNSISKTIFE